MLKLRLFIVLIPIVFFSCREQESHLNKNVKQFSLLSAKETGITFNNQVKDFKNKNILLYANYYGGAGVGIGDFNNDGLDDVYFAGNLVDDELYINQGNLKFKNVTQQSGIINDNTWSTGVTVADVNNDGLLDIYVSKELYDYQPKKRKNRLYINQGNAKFKEMASQYGVDNSERTRHAVFFDYNKDGFLDLFILNQPPNPGSYSDFFGKKLLLEKYSSRLYKNVDGRKFEDVTKSSRLLKAGFPNAVSASDLNNDGWIDLYVANDFYAPDFLYINNKDGTFSNIANEALSHMSYYSMGVDVSDINNDNFLDVFVVDMVAEDNFRLKSNMSGMNPSNFWKVVNEGGHYQYMYNNFHLNNGNNTYSDIAHLLNIEATDWSWSNLIADFDNDGKKDIYITNGLLRDIRNTDASKAVGEFVTQTANKWVSENPDGGGKSIWDILDLDKALALLPSEKLSNYMFQNKGSYAFNKVAKKWGLDQKSFSNGAAYADFDNDGDLDIIVNNINDIAFVYKNNSTNNFLRIKLKSKENKPLLGSRVVLKTQGKSQMIETTNVRGIYSTSEQVVHFGLDSEKTIDTLKVLWVNNTETILTNLKANQVLELFLHKGKTIKSNKSSSKKNKLVSDITNLNKINYTHRENTYDDYSKQVLLPHKMSQFGPAMAIADVNNDGLKDVFLGAASGYQSQLFIQNEEGNFDTKDIKLFHSDIIREDIDAVFFDVDNDNDQDLYVVSGGNSFKEKNKNYNDRLYINDGLGNFTKKKILENTNFSGSVVVDADFDNDGDIDVFVGGRHVPHQYPLPANSILLENKGGNLVDVTKQKLSDLSNLGLVTDAIWTDFDNDNDLDLMVVGEWMPITIFVNEKGFFLKKNFPSLSNTEGWWFSIEQGDFDNDGDMDYVVGNLGLNYKYRASVDEPFDVYYKDFDNNGVEDIVLGYYNYGKHYPLRGFSCSAQQIPNLKRDIKKYDVFASLDIEDVYGKKSLKESLHYKAKLFASSFIENVGNSKFKVSSLPIEAQFSNINDILIDDFNNDDFLDIIIAGNLYVSEIETPRNDASIGLVLLGDGKNKFIPLNHLETGLFTKGDVKKIKQLSDKNQRIIFVAKNDDKLQVFKR